MKTKFKGGKLCTLENIDGDIYTKGRQYIPELPHLWLDADNENIIIKEIKDKKECDNAKFMSEKFDFVPRYYGCYTCNNGSRRPLIYLVMEKINAVSLNPNPDDFDEDSVNEKLIKLNKYFPKIYEKYSILCDNGILWGDLFCRNVLVDDNDDVFFIDFEDEYIEFFNYPVPNRLTPEELLENMENDLRGGYYGGKKRRVKNKKTITKRKTYKKKKCKKNKSKKYN